MLRSVSDSIGVGFDLGLRNGCWLN